MLAGSSGAPIACWSRRQGLHDAGFRRSASAGRAAGAQRPRAGSRIALAAVAEDAAAASTAEDAWIAKALEPLSSVPVPPSLEALNTASANALRTMRMPTTRNEEYRFTDLSPLLSASVAPAAGHGASVDADAVAALALPNATGSFVVMLDGVFSAELSNLSGVPSDVYVGPLAGAPDAAARRVGELAMSRGGPFATLNGALTRDALVVCVPEGVLVEAPMHVVYLSSSGGDAAHLASSAPRLLLHAGASSSVEIVEEFCSMPGGDGHYFSCAVAEMLLEDEAQVTHGYAERDAPGAVHVKATLVQQSQSSRYALTEARVGGALSRHDVGVDQGGEETTTEMRHFVIAGDAQLHDLHTKLSLSHPRGEADQLHKCIVAHASGRGVFDGNVRVNKLAQQTDAKQLSRNLLLVPKATVNVKPNLQIIADDVKCTHGCAVSDLQGDELFYFRARGIDAEAARRALVASFGAEVTQRLSHKPLIERIQADVDATLASADIGAADES